MAKVTWTDQALEDLEAIGRFIARDSPPLAKATVSKLYFATSRLADYPFIGRIVPEAGRKSVREIIIGNYRIIYRASKREAEILTLHHAARLLDPDSLD